jgi:hypothetical protein
MFKYLRLLAQWKDVGKIYKEENGIDKPWYVSRRFFGTVVVFLGGALYAFFNVTIDADMVPIAWQPSAGSSKKLFQRSSRSMGPSRVSSAQLKKQNRRGT